MKNISLKEIICGRLAKESYRHEMRISLNSICESNSYHKIRSLFLLRYIESFFNNNNLLNDVINNIKKGRGIYAENLHDMFLKHNISAISLLTCGFDWSKTVQGSLFWAKINRKYINFLNDIIIEKKL